MVRCFYVGGFWLGFEAVARQAILCTWSRLYALFVSHASPASAQYAIERQSPLQRYWGVPTVTPGENLGADGTAPTALCVTSRVVAWAECWLYTRVWPLLSGQNSEQPLFTVVTKLAITSAFILEHGSLYQCDETYACEECTPSFEHH